MLRNRRAIFGIVTGLLVISVAGFEFGEEANADDLHLGIIEYEIACMQCHGLEGRGDGLLAKTLKTAPR